MIWAKYEPSPAFVQHVGLVDAGGLATLCDTTHINEAQRPKWDYRRGEPWESRRMCIRCIGQLLVGASPKTQKMLLRWAEYAVERRHLTVAV